MWEILVIYFSYKAYFMYGHKGTFSHVIHWYSHFCDISCERSFHNVCQPFRLLAILTDYKPNYHKVINFFLYITKCYLHFDKIQYWMSLPNVSWLCWFLAMLVICKPTLHKTINELFEIPLKLFHRVYCNSILLILCCWKKNFTHII
jgi:hypothetical protein